MWRGINVRCSRASVSAPDAGGRTAAIVRAVWEDIGAAVIGGLILAVILWLFGRRGVVRAWWTREKVAVEEHEWETEFEQLETLREQVQERARLVGATLPLTASGNQVTFSNGVTSTFIPGDRYGDALRSGRYRLATTVPGSPPVPLSRWDRARMEAWLEEHPLPPD